jgi:hypothetical protein
VIKIVFFGVKKHRIFPFILKYCLFSSSLD